MNSPKGYKDEKAIRITLPGGGADPGRVPGARGQHLSRLDNVDGASGRWKLGRLRLAEHLQLCHLQGAAIERRLPCVLKRELSGF